MLSRYRKMKEDSRFSAAEDRGRYLVCGKTNVFNLLLCSLRAMRFAMTSNSFYLQRDI